MTTVPLAHVPRLITYCGTREAHALTLICYIKVGLKVLQHLVEQLVLIDIILWHCQHILQYYRCWYCDI